MVLSWLICLLVFVTKFAILHYLSFNFFIIPMLLGSLCFFCILSIVFSLFGGSGNFFYWGICNIKVDRSSWSNSTWLNFICLVENSLPFNVFETVENCMSFMSFKCHETAFFSYTKTTHTVKHIILLIKLLVELAILIMLTTIFLQSTQLLNS